MDKTEEQKKYLKSVVTPVLEALVVDLLKDKP